MPRDKFIAPRRGTALEWATENPVLGLWEMGEESDTGKSKRGDGATAWNSLTYWGVSGSQDLQSVLDEGGYAESSDANSYVDINLDDTDPYFNFYANNSPDSLELFMSKEDFSIDIQDSVTNESGKIDLNKTKLELSRRGVDQNFVKFRLVPSEKTNSIVNLSTPNLEDGDYKVVVNATDYNATTNTPALSNSDTNKEGVSHRVTVAGTQDFGAGNITFAVGDIIANDGSVWYKKVDNNQSGGGTALATSYDNSNSSLVGENLQATTDELDSKKVNLTGDNDDILLGNGGTTSLSALDPNAEPIPEGQVYANNFETLIGLNLEETTGTVTLQTPIGTTVPNVTNALTVDYVASGNAYASIDLGSTYDELYIQYYVCVPNPSTATSYTDNLKVGSSVNGGTIAQVSMNHATNDFRAYGIPNFEFIGTRYMKAGVWYKIGMHIDRVAQTCDYYLDGRFSGQKATNNADMQFITLGGSGDNVSGYKIQYASLTVNDTEFQNTIVNDNGVGQYKTHYVDYSLKDSGLDMTGWSGMFSEPFDPDGGVNYIDGPALYLSDISGTNAYAKKYDFYKIKRGTVLKMKDLNTPHQLNLGATGYSDETYLTLDAYGIGDLPIIDTSIVADDTLWVLHDAVNFIYKQPITSINRLYGVWVDEDKGLNITTTYADLETTVGQAYTDNTDLFIRLYDNSDPSTHIIDVASNQNNLIRPYGISQNIHFRYGLTIHEGEGYIRDCEGTKGATLQVSNNAVAYDNNIHDQWGGKDYVSNNEGSSGAYGIIVGSSGKAIRNKVRDCYINIETSHSAVDVDIVYNDVRNAVVSNIECGGNAGGGSTVANPINISNNTVFHAPKTNQNTYPITGDQPGHGIVVQSGTSGSAYYRVLNNIILTHFNENLGQNGTPNCIALENASWGGEVDFNRYFISDASDSLPKYYGTGDDTAVWVSTLEANGWTGYNGVGKPEAHSKIDLLMSVISGEALSTGDEWLNVIPQPAYLGGAYPIDIETLEITKNLSEEELTVYRNIGAY